MMSILYGIVYGDHTTTGLVIVTPSSWTMVPSNPMSEGKAMKFMLYDLELKQILLETFMFVGLSTFYSEEF